MPIIPTVNKSTPAYIAGESLVTTPAVATPKPRAIPVMPDHGATASGVFI